MPKVNEAVFHNDGTCELTRRSPFSGETNTLRFKATRENFENWKKGQLIQVAFGHLDADTREFILTGITAKEWKETFSEEGDDNGTEAIQTCR